MREALRALVKRGGDLAEHDLDDEDPRRPDGPTKRSNHGAHGKGDEQIRSRSRAYSVWSVCSVVKRPGRAREPQLNDRVVEDGQPLMAAAIREWARRRTLKAVLDNPFPTDPRAGG